jgi:late competence protein required for DNA uptake (superfamily II DNA/RNA helicase)
MSLPSCDIEAKKIKLTAVADSFFRESLQCVICLDSLKDAVMSIPCSHLFCENCIATCIVNVCF